MSSLNRVMLIGHLGSDPELRYSAQAQPVATFRLATSDQWTDRDGQRQERTEWHRIVAFGRTAELCGEFLRKGRQTFVEGRLQTREWTDKEGHRHFTTEIVASQVTFLGGGRQADALPAGHEGGAALSGPAAEADIPF